LLRGVAGRQRAGGSSKALRVQGIEEAAWQQIRAEAGTAAPEVQTRPGSELAERYETRAVGSTAALV